MQRRYVQYAFAHGFNPKSADVDQLSGFAEYLILEGLALGTVLNYISAVKFLFKL